MTERPKILIAEDEGSIRALIRLTLDGGQVEILEAEDGPSALELARRERPELVFLDWGMPGSTGIEVARELRRDPALAGTKIVMITSHSKSEDRAAGLEAGADDYITKPFSPIELLDKVIEVLGPEALLQR